MRIEIIDILLITNALFYVIAKLDNVVYKMYIEVNDTTSEYQFYYLNGLKPSYDDFEYEILCNL